MYYLTLFRHATCAVLKMDKIVINRIENAIKDGVVISSRVPSTNNPIFEYEKQQHICRKDVSFTKMLMASGSTINVCSYGDTLSEYVDLSPEFRLMIDNDPKDKLAIGSDSALVLKTGFDVIGIRSEKDMHPISTEVYTAEPKQRSINIISPLITWLLFIGIDSDDIFIPKPDEDVIKKLEGIKTISCN